MSFSVAADRVIDGWWSVVDHNGSVARRLIRKGERRVPHPAVFRTRDEADMCASRWNAHLGQVADAMRGADHLS
jgi:hypothetical protein